MKDLIQKLDSRVSLHLYALMIIVGKDKTFIPYQDTSLSLKRYKKKPEILSIKRRCIIKE